MIGSSYNSESSTENRITGALFGLAVGDALGVPVEFKERRELEDNPVMDMIDGGIHSQPPGTWSDDTSLTLCLAASLTENGYDLNDQAERFVRWHREGYLTPHGNCFDIGNATSKALQRIENGVPPAESGGKDEWDNGNGGLMRILPAALYFANLPEDKLFENIRDIVSVTHGHPVSIAACFLYTLIIRNIYWGFSLNEAINTAGDTIHALFDKREFSKNSGYLNLFDRIFSGTLASVPVDEIRSGGYVVDSLIASLWCVLTTKSYRDSVLRAVNLGGDTDTTAAIAGGLAGAYYGYDSIPAEWINMLAAGDIITDLTERFTSACKAHADMPVPFPNSFWIIPGRLMAGEYPGSIDPDKAEKKVRKLIASGVNYIVDLTETGELDPYETYVMRSEKDCGTTRMSIVDFSIPDKGHMKAILDTIDSKLFSGNTVYFHCWGGHGRTGTVLGCWMKRHGIDTNETVFAHIRNLRSGIEDSHWDSPQTDDQRNFVKHWNEGE